MRAEGRARAWALVVMWLFVLGNGGNGRASVPGDVGQPWPADALGIEVEAPRPLAEAVMALSEQFDLPITYEDPPFESPDDLVALFPGSGMRIPRAGRVSMSFAGSATLADVVGGMLAQHNGKGRGGEFAFVEAGSACNVVCQRFKAADGVLVRCRPPLDTAASVPARGLSCAEALEEVLAAVSRVDPRVQNGTGMPPDHPLWRIPYASEAAGEEPARDVLNRILALYNEAMAGRPLFYTWQLRFSPPNRPEERPFYVLEFRRVRRGPHAPIKMRVIAKRPVASAVRILRGRYAAAISYEDPLYLAPRDVLGPADDPKGLRGGMITMQWDNEADCPGQVLEMLTQAASEQSVSGVFTSVEGAAERYQVHPVEGDDAEADGVGDGCVMSTKISLAADDVSALRLAALICLRLSEGAGVPVSLGDMPGPVRERLRSRTFPHVSMSETAARDCLEWCLCGSDNESVSWEVLLDPSSREYSLHLCEPPGTES